MAKRWRWSGYFDRSCFRMKWSRFGPSRGADTSGADASQPSDRPHHLMPMNATSRTI
jgi:hypothetical protein